MSSLFFMHVWDAQHNKDESALCFLQQDWQAQSTVSVTPHGRHKPSIQALGAALSMD